MICTQLNRVHTDRRKTSHSDLKNVFLILLASTTFMHTAELLRGKKLKTWFLCKLLETGTCMMILFQRNQICLWSDYFPKSKFDTRQKLYRNINPSTCKCESYVGIRGVRFVIHLNLCKLQQTNSFAVSFMRWRVFLFRWYPLPWQSPSLFLQLDSERGTGRKCSSPAGFEKLSIPKNPVFLLSRGGERKGEITLVGVEWANWRMKTIQHERNIDDVWWYV